MNPQILLMDEPLSALDETTRAEMQNMIIELHNKLHNTIIMVTHSKAEAENMIREQNTPKEGEEVVPSNPEKRPINDIRNEFENTNNKEEDNKDQNTN